MEAVADEIRERKRLNNLMLVASSRGYIADVKTLIQRGADINVRDKRNLTALHFAAGRGWLDVVQLLWSKSADLDAESSLGLTPLHLAALNGREDVVRFLLSKNALINVEDAEENTALHSAARGGHLGVVIMLLDAAEKNGGGSGGGGALAFLGVKNKLGLTPGACALLHGYIDITNKLVAQGWDVYHPGPSKFSLLHLTAAVGRSESVSWLLENGVGDVDDAENIDKVTPLHCAAVSGDVDTCQVLLDARADVDALDAKNQRPFDLIPGRSNSSFDPGHEDKNKYMNYVPAEVAEKLRDLLKPSSTKTAKKSPSVAVSNTKTTIPTSASSSPASRYAVFLSLSPTDQIRRARQWASLHPTELRETLQSYPGAEEAIRRVKMAIELKQTAEIVKAMASLRCDEEFQKDMAQPSVYKAVLSLRKNPALYDNLAQDLKVKSVVAKMGRIHAAVQANGQRTFAIEELIVPVKEIELYEKQDKERIQSAIHAMECQIAGAAAAAAASSKGKAAEAADKAVKEMKMKQWRKLEESKEIEEVVDDRDTATTLKERVCRRAEKETPFFDEAIAEAEGEEEGRDWRIVIVLAVLLIIWSLSLLLRWGVFVKSETEIQIHSIEIDGVKIEL